MADRPTGHRWTWANWNNSLGNTLMDKRDKINHESNIVEFEERWGKYLGDERSGRPWTYFYTTEVMIRELLRQNTYYLETGAPVVSDFWPFLREWYGNTTTWETWDSIVSLPEAERREILPLDGFSCHPWSTSCFDNILTFETILSKYYTFWVTRGWNR